MAAHRAERNIGDLIVRRFLAVLLPPSSRGKALTWRWRGKPLHARGKVVLSPAWRRPTTAPLPWRRRTRRGTRRSRASPTHPGGGGAPTIQPLPITGQDRAPGTLRPPSSPTRAPGRPGGRPGAGPDFGGDWRSGYPPPGRHHRTVFRAFYVEQERAGTHLQGRPGGGPGPGESCAAPPSLAQWSAAWEIAQGREQEGAFVDEMRQFVARLVPR
ncbi:MAG: hypothetical protein ACLT3D_03355 [Lawsonibacter sp.]